MKSKENALLKVYYDGLCKVCSREIQHYMKQAGSEKIDFVDICSPHFDPLVDGLDPVAIHKIMHVRRADGTFATRVDAFIEIWNTLPRYNWLARLAQNKLIRKTLDIGYTGFTLIRPQLPRYSKDFDCSDSPYCATKQAE